MDGRAGHMSAASAYAREGCGRPTGVRRVLGNVGGIAGRTLALIVVDLGVIMEGVYTFLGLGIYNPLTGQTTSGGVGNVVWLVSSAVVFVGTCIVWRPRRMSRVLVAAVFAAVVTAGLVDITYLTLHPAMLACCLGLALAAFGLGYVLSGDEGGVRIVALRPVACDL